MARISHCSSISCVLGREIDNKIDYCKRLVNARFEKSENLFRKDLLSHYGCVNAIEFSAQGDLLVSGGDDRRVLLWKVEPTIQGVTEPIAMKAEHVSNIFCLGYDNSKTKIFSAGNDDQVIVHDLRTRDVLNFFLHEKPIYGLSIHPFNDDVFASACDDGRVLIYDIRASSSTESFCLAQYKSTFHSVMFNPVEPRMLATANAQEGVSLWDVRKPLKPFLRYEDEGVIASCMNARFNATGNKLLALRRRLPPILFAVDSPTYLTQFDQPGYYNSCTMKSCCFAGDNDEYVLSGSDDFNLYMWKIPDDGIKWVDAAHVVLRGHRSIVNQVRYNSASCILASSGVEKIIKIWSPFNLGEDCLGGLKKDSGKQERQRRVFTHDEYFNLILRTGQFMTHDYSHQSTREDPRMMAFFDSVVQREIAGWSSEDLRLAPQLLSDSENNPTGNAHSATDSDDSNAVDYQLMSTLLDSAVNSRGSSGGGVAPERPSESPNRISRLIAIRREKLTLSRLNGGKKLKNVSTSSTKRSDASGSMSEISGAERQVKTRSKSVSRSRNTKRKHNDSTTRKTRPKRKCSVANKDSDTDSDGSPLLDATQPSTSSGVIPRKSRYVQISSSSGSSASSSGTGTSSNSSSNNSSSSNNTSGNSSSSVSSSSSNSHSSGNSSDSSGSTSEETYTLQSAKRKRSKTASETAVKNYRKKHRKRKNEKNSKNKMKRAKLDNKYQGSIFFNEDSETETNDKTTTPIKNTSKVPSTPDSGINSVEKNLDDTLWRIRNDLECSDHEKKLGNLECFRKKIDVARRSYRKRSTPVSQQTIPITSDSSD